MPRKDKGKEVAGRQVDNSEAARPQVASRHVDNPHADNAQVDNPEAVASTSAVNTSAAAKSLRHILSSPALHHMKMTMKLEGLKKARKEKEAEKAAHPSPQAAQDTGSNHQADRSETTKDKAQKTKDKGKGKKVPRPQPQPQSQNTSDRTRDRPASNRSGGRAEAHVPEAVASTSYPAEEAIRKVRNLKRAREAEVGPQEEVARAQAPALPAQAPVRPVRPVAKARKVAKAPEAQASGKAQVKKPVTRRSGRIVKLTLQARERQGEPNADKPKEPNNAKNAEKKTDRDADKNADKKAYKEARKEVVNVASSSDDVEQPPVPREVNQDRAPATFMTLKASDRPVRVRQPEPAHAQAGSSSHPQADSSQAEDLLVQAPVQAPVSEQGTEVPGVILGTPVPKPAPVANAPEVPRIALGTTMPGSGTEVSRVTLGTPMPGSEPSSAAEAPTVTLGTPLVTPSGTPFDTPTRTIRGGRVVRPTWKLRGG